MPSSSKIGKYRCRLHELKQVFETTAQRLGWRTKAAYGTIPGSKRKKKFLELSASRTLSSGAKLVIIFDPFSSRLNSRFRELKFTVELVVQGCSPMKKPLENFSPEKQEMINLFSETFAVEMDRWNIYKQAKNEDIKKPKPGRIKKVYRSRKTLRTET